ncbi:MAG TPA: sulfite exporter TauE/SafE family protein [Rhodopila sp.]|nr:sulfite exporter TauE/SafE family protein [Rhodopila sp.]
MIGSLDWIGGLCSAETVMQGGLLAGLFLAGAAGSVMHCGPMCGVFVLGQVSDRMARMPAGAMCESRRIRSGLLLPYHLGRLTTYGMLGALAGGSAAVFRHSGWIRQLSTALLVLAAVLFLAHAAGRLMRLDLRLDRAPRQFGQLIGRYAGRVVRGTAPGEFLLGLSLGFLPCGFLYAALASAAVWADPLMGAAAMVLFGLGTVPVLAMIGIAGHAAGRRWNKGVAAVAPAVMAVNAMLLLGLAWRGLT